MSKDDREHLVSFLIKELNGSANVKLFSQTLRELDLCDLQDDKHLEQVTKDGGAILATLVSWQQLGLLGKLSEIKKRIKE